MLMLTGRKVSWVKCNEHLYIKLGLDYCFDKVDGCTNFESFPKSLDNIAYTSSKRQTSANSPALMRSSSAGQRPTDFAPSCNFLKKVPQH